MQRPRDCLSLLNMLLSTSVLVVSIQSSDRGQSQSDTNAVAKRK